MLEPRATRTRVSRQVPGDGEIDTVLSMVLTLDRRRPHAGQPRRLHGLFRALGKPQTADAAEALQELIWAVWIGHDDCTASAAMIAAMEAMAAGALDLARPLLDELVGDHPDWAEAWNKRATLAFIERRDRDCLRDIGQTLLLEPRHFGAVAGFAQICLRHGRSRESAAALRVAIGLNPQLRGVREALEALGRDLAGPGLAPGSRLH